MGKLSAVLRLTRIEHSVMLVVAVLAAEFLAGGLPASLWTLALSLVTPIFVSMGSFAINDYFDVEVDRLNKKAKRPLVSGALSPNEALWVAGASFAIGVAASAFSASAFAIALVFALLAIIYASKLKEILLVGNAYIALSMVIPFIYGSYVESGALAPSILPVCAMVFLSGLAREIHGTIRDYSGDIKVRNARTLPKAVGIPAAAASAFVLYLAAIAISAYLFVYVAPFQWNLIYGGMVLISDVLLLYVSVGHLVRKDEKFYDGARNVSLVAMALAIFAILISALPLAHI
jgi:geranylgeranylglycerol-phosphate geranylgeranyltransferase